MKSLLIASLVLAPLFASPAAAASLEDHSWAGQHRLGTFAGARFRIAVGGEQAGRPRLGLAMAAIDYNRSADGRLRARFGEGAEYGFSPEGLRLSLAGQPVERHKHRLNASGSGGISDNVVFGVGIGIIVIGGAIGVIDAIGDD